ncbi:hypothetical protein [Sunxiuqinia rutila]
MKHELSNNHLPFALGESTPPWQEEKEVAGILRNPFQTVNFLDR